MCDNGTRQATWQSPWQAGARRPSRYRVHSDTSGTPNILAACALRGARFGVHAFLRWRQPLPPLPVHRGSRKPTSDRDSALGQACESCHRSQRSRYRTGYIIRCGVDSQSSQDSLRVRHSAGLCVSVLRRIQRRFERQRTATAGAPPGCPPPPQTRRANRRRLDWSRISCRLSLFCYPGDRPARPSSRTEGIRNTMNSVAAQMD